MSYLKEHYVALGEIFWSEFIDFYFFILIFKQNK